MDFLQTFVTDEWADWPKASPTSSRNINVRFYSVIDEDDGSSVRMDIGRETEQMLEALYEALGMDKRVPALSAVDFERYIRMIYQTRLEATQAYTLHLARYAVLTADDREMSRILMREKADIIRTLRLLPYRIVRQLVDRPTTFWGKAHYQLKFQLLRLHLWLLPLR